MSVNLMGRCIWMEKHRHADTWWTCDRYTRWQTHCGHADQMQTVSWNTQQPLGSCLNMQPVPLYIPVLNPRSTKRCSAADQSQCVQVTYGFMLNRSRTAMFALWSRLRLRSVQNLSLVQVMWTRSGDTSGLSFRAAWDAVFLSWISWACAVTTITH